MGGVLKYAGKRLAAGVGLVIMISILLFYLVRLMPGDPIDAMLGEQATMVSEARKSDLRAEWGLDKPIHLQYFYWAGSLLRGRMGYSMRTGYEIGSMLAARMPYTLWLTIISQLLVTLISIPLGMWAAFRHRKFPDKMVTFLTIFCQSFPSFWFALIFMILFSVKLRWLPISGYSGPASMILPVATLVVTGLGSLTRLARSEVLEVLQERHVATAYAKGLRQNTVLVRHVLRNAMVSVSVVFFLGLPAVIGGSIVVEQIFGLPGTGTMLFDAILSKDYAIVQVFVLMLSVLTIVCLVLGDIVTAILDPRIRVEMGKAMP